MGLFKLVDQAASYGAYHHNNINKVIHMIFVPAIVYSLFIFLFRAPIPAFAAPVVAQLNAFSPLFPVSISTPLAILLSLYYCILDVRVGLAATIWILAANYLAEYTILAMGANVMTFAIALHVVSWAFQFIGHGIFEGRRPALIDNLFQVFIAPFFVTLETIFALGLMSSTHIQVEKNIIRNIAAIKKNK
eukprot:gene14580-17240_t